jgi:hypothetical protein
MTVPRHRKTKQNLGNADPHLSALIVRVLVDLRWRFSVSEALKTGIVETSGVVSCGVSAPVPRSAGLGLYLGA